MTPYIILGFTGPTSLIVISVIALIIFGPKKLPQFGRAIGTTLKEFKSATDDLTKDHDDQKPSKQNDSK